MSPLGKTDAAASKETTENNSNNGAKQKDDDATNVYPYAVKFGKELKPCLIVNIREDENEILGSRAREVLAHLRETWDLENPPLLLSLKGTRELHSHQRGLKKIIEEGVLDAATKLGAWLITDDEKENGLAKIVGKSVRDYFRAHSKQPKPKHQITAFMVALFTNFNGNPTFPGQSYKKNYTHYILLEGNADMEIVKNFRTELEKAIENWRSIFLSNANTDGCITTPVVELVMGDVSANEQEDKTDPKQKEEEKRANILIKMPEERNAADCSFDPSKETLFRCIQETALIKCKEARCNEKELGQQFVMQAIRWKRWDLFQNAEEKGLILQTVFSAENMEDFFKEALLQGQYDFIRYFLSVGACMEGLKNTIHKNMNTIKGGESFEQLIRKAVSADESDKADRLIAVFTDHVMRKRTPGAKSEESINVNDDDKNWKRDLFLYAILYNHPPLAQICWEYGKDQLAFALLASALLKRLSIEAENEALLELTGELRAQADDWETRACEVLTECSKLDEETASLLLTRSQDFWGGKDKGLEEHGYRHRNHGFRGTTLLTMAEYFEMMRFTEHTVCQATLKSIWRGGIPKQINRVMILLNIFCPFLLFVTPQFASFVRYNRVGPLKSKREQREQKHMLEFFGPLMFYKFYTAPITKFYCYTIAYMIFLGVFSFFLLTQLSESAPGLWEYVVWAWHITATLEEFRQLLFRNKGSPLLRVTWYFSNGWNQFDMAISLLFIVSALLRFLLPLYGGDFHWARAAYSVTLLVCFLRFMHTFYEIKSMGPKIIMIKKMMDDMFLFLAILSVFLLGFGIAYHANMFPEAPLDWSILVNILYYPYFQMYGELFLDTFQGNGDDSCTTDEAIWREDPSKRCPDDSKALIMFLLAVFLILTNVLLLNLLIAMFSYTFQTVHEKSQTVWKFYHVTLVHDYVDSPTLVPPFIIFNHIFRIILFLHRKYSKGHFHNKDKLSDKNEKDKKTCVCFERLGVREYLMNKNNDDEKDEGKSDERIETLLDQLRKEIDRRTKTPETTPEEADDNTKESGAEKVD